MSLSWAEFEKVDMRVGIVVEEIGRASSAQITHRYAPADLVGRRVVAVVNFPPKQIGPFVSEVLVLGAYDERGEVILLRPDFEVAPGARIG